MEFFFCKFLKQNFRESQPAFGEDQILWIRHGLHVGRFLESSSNKNELFKTYRHLIKIH